MAIHKLHIDAFDEVDYELIAIHTSLEDYRLAYFLNQKLPILLSKSGEEIQINRKDGEVYFSRFLFEDEETETYWNLIQNKNEVLLHKKDNSLNLFANASLEESNNVCFLPEFKKVDYFLKIDNPFISIEKITNNIHSIDRISAAYTVDSRQIKSKNNLIF